MRILWYTRARVKFIYGFSFSYFWFLRFRSCFHSAFFSAFPCENKKPGKTAIFRKIFWKKYWHHISVMLYYSGAWAQGVLCPCVSRLICDDAGGDCARTQIISAEYVRFKTGRSKPYAGWVCALTGPAVCCCGESFLHWSPEYLAGSGF